MEALTLMLSVNGAQHVNCLSCQGLCNVTVPTSFKSPRWLWWTSHTFYVNKASFCRDTGYRGRKSSSLCRCGPSSWLISRRTGASTPSWLNYRPSSMMCFTMTCTSELVTLLFQTRMHSSRMRTVRCSSRLPGGVSAGGCLPGACLPGGVCQGVSAKGMSAQVGVCPGGLPKGVSTRGDVCPGGVCSRGCLPGGCLPDTSPVDRMTDMCKNITLPQLRCGR